MKSKGYTMANYFIIKMTKLLKLQRNQTTDVIVCNSEYEAMRFINDEYRRIRNSDLCRIVNYSSCPSNYLMCNFLEYREIIADTDDLKCVTMTLVKEVE